MDGYAGTMVYADLSAGTVTIKPTPPIWTSSSRISCPQRVKSVLTGNRLKPVTAAAEVEVNKASIKDKFRVAAPGIMNKAVPIAINTISPETNWKATGTWREFGELARAPIRIKRCL